MITTKSIVFETYKALHSIGLHKFNLLMIAHTGSGIFKPDSEVNDYDFVVIVDSLGGSNWVKLNFTNNGRVYDLYVSTYDYHSKRLGFEVLDPRSVFNILNRFHTVLHGEQLFPNKPDVFSNKATYKDIIRDAVSNFGFNPKSTTNEPRWKHFVSPYLALKVMEQGSYELTQEIRDDILGIYNGKRIDLVQWVGNQVGLKLNPRIKEKYNIE